MNVRRTIKRIMLLTILSIVGAYCVVVLVLYTQQRKMLYPINWTPQNPKPIQRQNLSIVRRSI